MCSDAEDELAESPWHESPATDTGCVQYSFANVWSSSLQLHIVYLHTVQVAELEGLSRLRSWVPDKGLGLAAQLEFLLLCGSLNGQSKGLLLFSNKHTLLHTANGLGGPVFAKGKSFPNEWFRLRAAGTSAQLKMEDKTTHASSPKDTLLSTDFCCPQSGN